MPGVKFVGRDADQSRQIGMGALLSQAQAIVIRAIVGKIDGLVYFTKAIKPDVMEEFQREFFLILNVAMGGSLGSNSQPPTGRETFPQTMLVDYVRVYQRVD